MNVKLLTEHRLEFISLKGGCIGSSESTLVKNATLCRGSNCVLCAKSVFVRPKPPRANPTTCGVIVGFFDLKHMSVNHYPVPLSAADTISSAGPSPPPPPSKRM